MVFLLHNVSSTVSSETDPETPLSLGMPCLLVSLYLTFASYFKYLNLEVLNYVFNA